MNNQFNTPFYGNKSSHLSEINIYQLRPFQAVKAPNFNNEASISLNMDFQRCKQIFHQNSQQFKKSASNSNINYHNNASLIDKNHLHNHNLELQLSKDRSLNNLKIDKLNYYEPQNALLQQNRSLKRDLLQMTKLYQQQKQKYNELKNLYKQGQSMFALLDDRRIQLERQNKQLKQILDNLYNQLHNQNQTSSTFGRQLEHKSDLTRSRNNDSAHKIKKIKIGNKKVPLIKVNVPPEIFMKKDHTKSIFSVNSDESNHHANYNNNHHVNQFSNQPNYQISENQSLRQQKQHLIESNNSMIQQLNQTKRKLAQNQNSYSSYHFNTINYLQSKILVMQSQINNKNQKIKKLENQCSQLARQVSSLSQKLKINASVFNKSRFNHQSQPQTKYISQMSNKRNQNPNNYQQNLFNRSFEYNQTLSKQRPCTSLVENDKVHFLQQKLLRMQKSLNQVNLQSFQMNNNKILMHLSESVDKLTLQNSSYKQKVLKQQFQLNRLYTILQNKNIELGQIYSVMKQSKRSISQQSSKKKYSDLQQTYSKKQIQKRLINSPQRETLDLSHQKRSLFTDIPFIKDQYKY